MPDNSKNLKNIGLKATYPRLKILDLFQHSDTRHMTAEDGYRQLMAEDMDIGLATVYRVLTQFEQAGLLERHYFESGKAVFELNEDRHHDAERLSTEVRAFIKTAYPADRAIGFEEGDLRGFIWAEAPVSSTPGPSDVPSGQGAAGVERGKELFAEANPRCTLCHAVAGKGNPQGPSLDGVGKRLGRDEIKAWIRGPVEMAKKRGVSRKPAMLPYPEFSDEELEAMVSYLVSLEPRPRP